jgi:quercetin dioxygenase-like cupin family protein
MRAAIDRLQANSLASDLPRHEPITEHHHADGMYLRPVWSPKGAVIVGKVHKQEHFYMVLSGVVQVTMGEKVIEINATRDGPQIFVCPPGTKRAVCVIEDAWRATVHRNHQALTDIGELEDSLVEPDETSMFLPGNKLKCEAIK